MMDAATDSSNPAASRGVYSPASAAGSAKDGHTPAETELSKETMEGLRRLVENYASFTTDLFLASFRTNYGGLKTFLLRTAAEPEQQALKTQCFELLEAYTKVEPPDVQLRREIVSICLSTLVTSTSWDEVCHRILKCFLVDAKQFVNLAQVELFFEYTIKMLSSYPNVQDKEVKRLLLFVNILEMFFTSPLFTKNLMQLLPVLTKVIGFSTKEHIKDCYVELVRLSCASLHLFNSSIKQNVNYTYYVNDIYSHLVFLFNSTATSNTKQLTHVLNMFLIFVTSGVNKTLFKSILESELYAKFYTVSLDNYSLTCNVLLLMQEIVKRLEPERFNLLIFERCQALIMRHWLCSDYRIRELCFNLIFVMLTQLPKALQAMDEEAVAKVNKFALSTLFNAFNYIADMHQAPNKSNNGYLLYFKNMVSLLLEVVALDYKLLAQMSSLKRIVTVSVLRAFLMVVQLVLELYRTLATNRAIKMENDDDEKNEFLIILDCSVRMLCRTLESPYSEDAVRMVLPVLIYYYLTPNKKLLSDSDMDVDEGQGGIVSSEGAKVDELKEREGLVLYVLYALSKAFPALFLQQYLSLAVQLINGVDLNQLYKYSYNVIFRKDPKLTHNHTLEAMLPKLVDENIFVGFKYNLDCFKHVTHDLAYVVGVLYNSYPGQDASSLLDARIASNAPAYYRLLATLFSQVNQNPNCSYVYDQMPALSRFIYRTLFYLELASYRHVDLLSDLSSHSFLDLSAHEDMYVFIFVVSMRNTSPEYVKRVMRMANYVVNYAPTDRLLKHALMVVESYADNMNIQDLYYMLSKYIQPLNSHKLELDDPEYGCEPYFVKLLLSYLVNRKDMELNRVVLNVLGKMGSLAQKYRVRTKLKSTQEFTLALPCASQKDSTIVSLPLDQGLDAMMRRLAENLRAGGAALMPAEYDAYAGYLLVAMSPMLHYNSSLARYYVSTTDGSEDTPSLGSLSQNRRLGHELDPTQLEYMRKQVRCLFLLLNNGALLDTKKSAEYENLVLFKSTLLDYCMISSPTARDRENVLLLVSLFMSSLDVGYASGCTRGGKVLDASEDSCLQTLLDLFERLLEGGMNDVLEHYVTQLILSLNDTNVYRRVTYLTLLLQHLSRDQYKHFEQYSTYLYNMAVCTLVDLNGMDEDLKLDKARGLGEEGLLYSFLKLLATHDRYNAVNALLELLNDGHMKVRLLAMQLLAEADHATLVQYLNANFKGLQYLDLLFLSTQHTQNQQWFNTAFRKLLSALNSFKEESVEMVVYLALLEEALFSAKYEKLFKQLTQEQLDSVLTTLINFVMASSGLLFSLSFALLRRLGDRLEVTQSILLTLQPYTIQLQTIFNNTTVKKLALFFDVYGNELKCIKDSLYDVAGTLKDSKLSTSELQRIDYVDFLNLLTRLGYSNKALVNSYISTSNVTTPIMALHLHTHYSLGRSGSDYDLRFLDELKMHDLMYLADESVAKAALPRLSDELSGNNLNVVYEILCYLEYLSNTKNALVSSKEFKNALTTVVSLSNPDVFVVDMGSGAAGVEQAPEAGEEKDLDELMYTLISNACYQLLESHYPSTADILTQYKNTPYWYLAQPQGEMPSFNSFVLENLELLNSVYVSRSASHYLYNTKLMTLMRMVYLVNNEEPKGNMVAEITNYVYHGVLFPPSGEDAALLAKQDLLDSVLCRWMGYYVLSKLCQSFNINYLVVAALFKGYVKLLKSIEFAYMFNNLQNVPLEVLLVMNNTYASGPSAPDVDEFNNFYLILKKVALSFFNCLCNVTVYDTWDPSKKYHPLVLRLFDLARPAPQPPASPEGEGGESRLVGTDTTIDFFGVGEKGSREDEAFGSEVILLGSFVSCLNNYRKLMREYLQRLVEYMYRNNSQAYYYNRYALEIVVGMMLIFESNKYQYDRLKLLTVYFRILNNLKAHVNRFNVLREAWVNNATVYRYNVILCKLYNYDILKYVSSEGNRALYNNLILKLLVNDYPQLHFVAAQVVEIPYFTSQASVDSMIRLHESVQSEKPEERNNRFLDFLLTMTHKFLQPPRSASAPATALTSPTVGNSSAGSSNAAAPTGKEATTGYNTPVVAPRDEDDEGRVCETVKLVNLFVDVAKLANVKSVLSLANRYLPLFVNRLAQLLSSYSHLDKDLGHNFFAFMEFAFLLMYRFDSATQSAFLKVAEAVAKYHKHATFNLLVGLFYVQPLLERNKQSARAPSPEPKRPEYRHEEDMEFDFFDYTGSYTEISSDVVSSFKVTDLCMTNKRVSKISFNQVNFAKSAPEGAELVPRDLFRYVKYNLDHFKFDLICNIMYHLRYLSYETHWRASGPGAGDAGSDHLEMVRQFNALYLSLIRDDRFAGVRLDVKLNYLTHASHLARDHLDFHEHYGLQDNIYYTLELLFKHNQTNRTMLNSLFTLFGHDIEIAISRNYPRLWPLNAGPGAEGAVKLDREPFSQINFVCSGDSAGLVKPIVGVLKDFRNLSLTSPPAGQEPADSRADSSASSGSRNELELNLDSTLYEKLLGINRYNKVYLERYLNLRRVVGYVARVCALHPDYGDYLFVKLFNQLYVNLSEPYRNQLLKQIVLFITSRVNALSVSNNLYYHPEVAAAAESRPEHCVDEEEQLNMSVLNLVYVAAINTYPLIVLPVEVIKYLAYYLGGNYYNTCYYLEKLILTQPLDITKIASILSDLYMKLDLMDMAIGSNRCWVITNETRLALANLQHSKWKQAQREFNQIMEYLASSGQSSETVAWFDESKLWFNYWLYCTKQLNEWDVIRDIAYTSNNKLLFHQSNVYLNSYPHLVTTQPKESLLLLSQDPAKDMDTLELENILNMNVYGVVNRLHKTFNPMLGIPLLHKTYGKEYHRLRSVTSNCATWLLRYYRNMGPRLNHGHVNCMRMNQRLVELGEGLSYLRRVTESIYKLQSVNESQLINRWRARLPSKSDNPSNWNTLLSFRTIVYTAVKNLMSVPNNTQAQNDSLLMNQDYIWTLVKYSCVTRKSHQLPLMASVLLNKAQRYLVTTMSKSSNIGEDYYLLINERLKQYLSFSINVPDALKSVISLDFDKLPNRGFETLKAHVTRLKAEAINRNYIYDVHQSQNNPDKRQMTTSIGDIDLACKYMLEALKLQPLLSKNWISWAKFNDNKIDHSLISVWSKNEQMFPLELYETSIMGYLTAISINPNCHWLLIKRIFTLLNEIHKSIGSVSESFKKYSEYVHHCVWLTWLPQLVGYLYTKNSIEVFHLLKALLNKVPQQLYYTLRTEYMALTQSPVGPSAVPEEFGDEAARHSPGDVKNILQILLNNNASLNQTLENFCNLLTNMGKPDLLDEVMCAYETIFEECLDLPFHEHIPKPMLYCITNKIPSKLNISHDSGAGSDYREVDRELYDIVYNFTQDLLKPVYGAQTPSSMLGSPDHSNRSIPCGYTMNKLLDVINALVAYSRRRSGAGRGSVAHLLNHSICTVSNRLATNSGPTVQLPHVLMNGLDDILSNKNVLGDVHDLLYVDPRVVKVRRRNQLVKCLKLVTADGQSHHYALYPLVRHRQKNEEYLFQMSQLFNFYFKKYNETRRRNVWIPARVLVPLDPYVCLVRDRPSNLTLLTLYNRTVSVANLLSPAAASPVSGSPGPSSGATSASPGSAELGAVYGTLSTRTTGRETCLLLLILHKILLEKNITSKLYECYNKYNPSYVHALQSGKEEERNLGFNYIYKLFKDKQYPWFITWYRKIHQDVLQDSYNKLCNLVPDNVLLSHVMALSTDYQAFVAFRMNFTATYATHAVLSLILATPYATPSRLVLDLESGVVRQLDYKLFNRDMEPNKLRVFRLTRNMTNLIGATCRLGLLPAVMFSVASSVHHFKIDIHAALSAILSGGSLARDKEAGAREPAHLKEGPHAKDESDDVDEYLSKILNYCTYLRSPADQEHSSVPINNMITCIIDASTDSSMLGKLKTSYQPWF